MWADDDTESGYSRLAWDRLMEALIDPENREACGRIVSEPGTDVEQSKKNVFMTKVHRLHGQIYHSCIERYRQGESFWCIRLSKANRVHCAVTKMYPYGSLLQKRGPSNFGKKTRLC